LYVDSEFGRLYQDLEKSGTLENTWVILTSDHGEMFERGILGHADPVFYQPIVKIPLVIFPPGQSDRIDVYENTSAIDLLPTILSVTQQNIPSWIEGEVLVPFSERNRAPERDITSVQVERFVNGKITTASAMCLRENFKAMWFFGYDELKPQDEVIELYDLFADPEELNDISSENEELTTELINVLKAKIDQLERAYSLE
jgi:arylsulfatase A-like enzyme